MSATAAAFVAPATSSLGTRRTRSSRCVTGTQTQAFKQRGNENSAAAFDSRRVGSSSSRKPQMMTRIMSGPIESPELDRAMFAAATGLFSPVGTCSHMPFHAYPRAFTPFAMSSDHPKDQQRRDR